MEIFVTVGGGIKLCCVVSDLICQMLSAPAMLQEEVKPKSEADTLAKAVQHVHALEHTKKGLRKKSLVTRTFHAPAAPCPNRTNPVSQ